MRSALVAAVERNRGVLTRADALTTVPPHVVGDAIRSGAIAAVFRGVYCLAGREGERDIRRRAAVLAVPGSALSHTDALATVRLLDDRAVPDGPAHVCVAAGTRRPGRQPGLRVHRVVGFSPLALTTGHVVLDPHRATVQSWPLLPDEVRRSMIVDAVRARRLSTAKLRAVLARNTVGAADIRALLDLIEGGCQSMLEIFGLTRVFDHPSLPRSVAQRRVQLRTRTAVLDRAYDDVLVGVELDGAAYHFGREQRERDMRRDAELAALGWLVLRFSYRRVVHDPDGVRAEVARVLATRRAQFNKAVGA